MAQPEQDDLLAFTVSSVWREERVSCPHPDNLRAYEAGALEAGAMAFLRFHLEECQCPYCNAVLEDMRARDAAAPGTQLKDLRDHLLRSTRAALRRRSG